jgi:glutamate---cysteine ligase / carboxylate-amine ligase
MTAPALHLFEAFGVELEYMIVDAESLDVRPISDELFRDATGQITSDVELADVSWSNELVLHVVELKTSEPARSLASLAAQFQQHVGRVNELLARRGARLLPTGMHPWMDPHTQTRLWPHDSSEFYEAFDRIFDCRGHGWANLQSVHLNLPFADDSEFARLHAAIRLLLPILPALAASSPVMDARATGLLDNRLDVYRTNCRRIASVTGAVIPEPVFSRADYQRQILDRMYADLAPHDPGGILRHEWANARGAIARFSRNTIEIRVLDVQECPAADLAICAAAARVLGALAEQRYTPLAEQQLVTTDALAAVLHETTREGERAVVRDANLLRQFGFADKCCKAGELWRHLAETLDLERGGHTGGVDMGPLAVILEQGPLARRILTALGGDLSHGRLHEVYGELANCLAAGRVFTQRGGPG